MGSLKSYAYAYNFDSLFLVNISNFLSTLFFTSLLFQISGPISITYTTIHSLIFGAVLQSCILRCKYFHRFKCLNYLNYGIPFILRIPDELPCYVRQGAIGFNCLGVLHLHNCSSSGSLVFATALGQN